MDFLDRDAPTMCRHVLCEDHFEANQFMNPSEKGMDKKLKKLRHDAVPTLFSVPDLLAIVGKAHRKRRLTDEPMPLFSKKAWWLCFGCCCLIYRCAFVVTMSCTIDGRMVLHHYHNAYYRHYRIIIITKRKAFHMEVCHQHQIGYHRSPEFIRFLYRPMIHFIFVSVAIMIIK